MLIEVPERHPASAKTMRACAAVDAMPRDLRQCVHEFGYAIVNAFTLAGVTSPTQIRRLVQECWMGARQPNQRPGTFKPHSPVLDQLDWLLIQSGAGISAATLIRVLAASNMVIIPRSPADHTIDASMAAVNINMGPMTKREKHRRRLRAAIEATIARLWPHLLNPGKASS